MTAYTALCALSAIDERYLADAEQRPVRRFPVKRILAAVACAAVLCVGGVLTFFNLAKPSLSDRASALYEPTERPLITSYPIYIEASYCSPRDGDVLLFLDVSAALEHYKDEDVQFWVRLTVHSDGGELNFTEADADAEITRLAGLGYDVYTRKNHWIGYWGEDKHYTTICLKMTADELLSFEEVAADDRFGYAFDFADGIDVADCTPATAN